MKKERLRKGRGDKEVASACPPLTRALSPRWGERGKKGRQAGLPPLGGEGMKRRLPQAGRSDTGGQATSGTLGFIHGWRGGAFCQVQGGRRESPLQNLSRTV